MLAPLLIPLVTACSDSEPDPVGPADPAPDGVAVLSKAEGWREDLRESLGGDDPYALVEIAFDQETAERAWTENVPEGQAERDGTPDQPGRYGGLEEVDFDTHAVVVWSSGESGSCPAWLDGIRTDGQGAVELTTGQTGTTCTDDFRPYRMLLAVHQDQLPEPTWLPVEDVSMDGRPLDWGGLVRAYPAA